ncbi:MAG TPA: hypothetical protein VLG47_02525 [Candidatus Saccharimonadales bacterium]|nr:hypothetical protein [Candidatus Saccharimonadales bacterium]
MIEGYRAFFAASAGASAAFIGLLFVALSFIDSGNVDEKVKSWRRILANSSFSQLINIFFVSLLGLLPDPHNFALVGAIMALLGIVVSVRLLPQTMDREKTGRNTPTRIGILAVGAYVLELICCIGLLHNPQSQTMFNYLILSIIILYAGALARAWEITGIKRSD